MDGTHKQKKKWKIVDLQRVETKLCLRYIQCQVGSVVGIATGYGLDGSGIESL
jgi:hypothetical protein